jgi:hypothetical protein
VFFPFLFKKLFSKKFVAIKVTMEHREARATAAPAAEQGTAVYEMEEMRTPQGKVKSRFYSKSILAPQKKYCHKIVFFIGAEGGEPAENVGGARPSKLTNKSFYSF